MSDSEAKILKTIKETMTLPTMPAVAIAILRLSQDPRVSIEKVAETMEKDPALAAKTLRFANSSYYASTQPIISLQQALVRIGLRGARMLALSFSLVEACHRDGVAGFDFSAYWNRSLTTSVAARRIANRSVRKLAEQAFIAALLADIGCPLLARTFPTPYRSIGKIIEAGSRDVAEVEERLLGIGHPRVSAMLLEHWRLPSEMVAAVAAHHDLTRLERDSQAFTIAAVVMAASDLAEVIIHGTTQQRISRLATVFREYFSFTGEHLDLLLRDLGPEIRQIGTMLDVPLPPIDLLHANAKTEMLKLAMFGAASSVPAAEAAAVSAAEPEGPTQDNDTPAARSATRPRGDLNSDGAPHGQNR